MRRAKAVFKTVLLGGLLVILPVTIVTAVFRPAERVRLIDAGVEEAMRSIISCGAGSSRLLAMRHAGGTP